MRYQWKGTRRFFCGALSALTDSWHNRADCFQFTSINKTGRMPYFTPLDSKRSRKDLCEIIPRVALTIIPESKLNGQTSASCVHIYPLVHFKYIALKRIHNAADRKGAASPFTFFWNVEQRDPREHPLTHSGNDSPLMIHNNTTKHESPKQRRRHIGFLANCPRGIPLPRWISADKGVFGASFQVAVQFQARLNPDSIIIQMCNQWALRLRALY